MNKEKACKISYHIVSITLVLLSLFYTLFFARNVSLRTFQAGEDFGRTFVYQFIMMLMLDENAVQITVTSIPSDMETLLPLNLEELKQVARLWWDLLISWHNLSDYFATVGNLLAMCLTTLTILMMVFTLVFIIALVVCSEVDTDIGKKSKALRCWAKIEDKVICPVYRYVKGYGTFLFKKEVRKSKEVRRRTFLYFVVFLLTWCWALNIITIVLEALAYSFWACWWYTRWGNILVQLAKLAVDLSVIFQTLPTVVLIIIGYLLFNFIRRRIGFKRLDKDEKKNEKFLEDNPGNLLATGRPRVGKTMAITDMGLTENVRFRKIAQDASWNHRLEFPFFPWRILEKTIEEMRKLPFFKMQLIRDFFAELQEAFEKSKSYSEKERENKLGRFQAFGYTSKDFIFGYDHKRYGLEYDNNLKMVSIWESIELYAEEYAIYTSPTPFIISNYPIRTAIKWKTYGNYPLMKANFFKIKPAELVKMTEWSHIVNHNALRLGVKMDVESDYNGVPHKNYSDNYDCGCIVLSELGKELGNQITNRGKQNQADSKECTPNNDLWTMNAKMVSHGLTIDFNCYARILADEQRAMSVLADFREIGSEMRIVKKHREKIKMPFFAFGELAYALADKYLKKALEYFVSRHGKMTLGEYFIIRLYKWIFDKYNRIKNQFGSYQIDVKIKDNSTGENDEESTSGKYYVARKKTCADVYDTGFFGIFYREKFKRSTVGGTEKAPQYTGLQPTIPQMQFTASRMNRDVIRHFYADVEEEKEQEKNKV